jgi:hypothetical protein
MILPLPWIEKIFMKLTLNFGREFLDRWKGIDIDEVKADWAHELRGFQQNPAAIAFALENCMTGKPPTAQEFKAWAIRRPDSKPLALPEPLADPGRVAAELKKLENIKAAERVDHKAWAKRLKQRHESGEKLNMNQVRCFRNALGIES